MTVLLILIIFAAYAWDEWGEYWIYEIRRRIEERRSNRRK